MIKLGKPKYSRLIKCKLCGKNFKGKLERGNRKYCCSGYENYGNEFCERIVVSEKELDELIGMRYDKNLTDDEVREEVENIQVGENELIINYKNGEPAIITGNYAQF
jgi:hypothetical protein